MKSYTISIETKRGRQLGYTDFKCETENEALSEFKQYIGHLSKCKLLKENEVYYLYDNQEDVAIAEVKNKEYKEI